MTAHRRRTAADWMESELYLGGPYPPLTAWEAHRASLLVLVVLACLLVAWLVWGGRG
jgi:NADH:ubiquinone oxidoreductase subunit H